MTTATPTADTVRAAGAALARAALFDDRITDGDPARIAAWSEAIAPHDLDAADMLEAVTRHYSASDARVIRVGDVIATAREVRRERGLRANAREATTPIAQPDPQLGGLPIGGADGKPIWSAYDANHAITRTCPACGAPPDHACRNNAADTTRKIPCVARITAKAGRW